MSTRTIDVVEVMMCRLGYGIHYLAFIGVRRSTCLQGPWHQVTNARHWRTMLLVNKPVNLADWAKRECTHVLSISGAWKVDLRFANSFPSSPVDQGSVSISRDVVSCSKLRVYGSKHREVLLRIHGFDLQMNGKTPKRSYLHQWTVIVSSRVTGRWSSDRSLIFCTHNTDGWF